MKNKVTLIACMSVLFLLGSDMFTSANESLALLQEAPVYVRGFPEPNPFQVVGEAKLIRYPEGISFELQTLLVTPNPEDKSVPVDLTNHALTVWCVIFNLPENCSDAQVGPLGNLCGAEEQRDPEGLRLTTMADLLRVEGDIVEERTVKVINDIPHLRLSGSLPVGDTTESIRPQPFGIANPLGAEIHFLIQSHGQFDREHVLEQIHVFRGFCNSPFEASESNPNGCNDVQSCIFEAPSFRKGVWYNVVNDFFENQL